MGRESFFPPFDLTQAKHDIGINSKKTMLEENFIN